MIGCSIGINMMKSGDLYGLAFTVLFNVAPLFQLYRIVVNRDSTNNSYGLWICGILGQMCVLSYYRHNDVDGVFNYINSVLGLILNSVMVVLIYVYRRQK